MENQNVPVDKNLIARCGLYCGACRTYLAKKCLGCKENIKALRWCKIKVCTEKNNFKTCASCDMSKTSDDLKKCKKFNNFFTKIINFLFKSNKYSCIRKIREVGIEKYAEYMAKNKKFNSCD